MSINPRKKIGSFLNGEILEIGPGLAPFPTAQNAEVKYADRSVEGGRDATWPELIGQPPGINAEFDINLDVDGLSVLADESFDAVVTSHLVEHLANPINSLREFERVLRNKGKLVLILPDRALTFDSIRLPTEFEHLLHEFRNGVTVVSSEHIKEFCEAIYGQAPIHPHKVREWHNPDKLDDTLLALHRRRSIHVHCWSPEEFASFIVGLLWHGLLSFTLKYQYFKEDDSADCIEFGLVLEKTTHAMSHERLCSDFIDKWVALILDSKNSDVRRVARFQQALYRDFRDIDEFDNLIFLPSVLLANHIVSIT